MLCKLDTVHTNHELSSLMNIILIATVADAILQQRVAAQHV